MGHKFIGTNNISNATFTGFLKDFYIDISYTISVDNDIMVILFTATNATINKGTTAVSKYRSIRHKESRNYNIRQSINSSDKENSTSFRKY